MKLNPSYVTHSHRYVLRRRRGKGTENMLPVSQRLTAMCHAGGALPTFDAPEPQSREVNRSIFL
jgi:hypothetical protein